MLGVQAHRVAAFSEPYLQRRRHAARADVEVPCARHCMTDRVEHRHGQPERLLPEKHRGEPTRGGQRASPPRHSRQVAHRRQSFLSFGEPGFKDRQATNSSAAEIDANVADGLGRRENHHSSPPQSCHRFCCQPRRGADHEILRRGEAQVQPLARLDEVVQEVSEARHGRRSGDLHNAHGRIVDVLPKKLRTVLPMYVVKNRVEEQLGEVDSREAPRHE